MGDPLLQAGPAAAVKLSETSALSSQGLHSMGALMHDQGRCCPCLMLTLHKTGVSFKREPCRFGLLCGRCHEDHDTKDIRELRAECRRRSRRGVRASLSGRSVAE